MDVDWGAVPDWLSAAGSLFALAFGAVALVVTRRTFRIESERDRINAEIRHGQLASVRAAQATRLSAWWGQAPDGRWGTFVRNASEAPVYQVYVTVLGPDDHSDQAKVHHMVIPPAEQPRFCPVDISAAPPDTARRVKLTFTDGAGVRWLRNQYGALVAVRPELRIKADPARVSVLSEFRADFLAAYGVTVTFDADADRHPQRRFMADVEMPSVADVMVCPHDWIGALIARDVVEPTVLAGDQLDVLPRWALHALTVDGRLYGVPSTVDTVALIRNTRLAPQPPASFEELVATGEALRRAGRVDDVCGVRVGEHGDPFQIWPLFTSAGGWLFGRTPDGRWDPTVLGLATPESVAAFRRLHALGEAGTGLLRRSMDREAAFRSFVSERTPYLLSTTDALPLVLATTIPVEVDPVPPFETGRPASSFSLVHGLLMAKHGANKVIAHDLIADYVTHEHVMSTLSDRLGAPVALRGAVGRAPAIRRYLSLCEAATPMPSFPQMEQTWRILEFAMTAVIAGADPEPTAREAGRRLAALFG
ncbi:extracellular solute-binding protein [Embleya sp. NPDC050493]|uniref:sugar ABC transporter substrate-binding protein n=1 Tax=Embleya sp. NPDC050493 TaxID=3363989 RepID=UPI00378AFF47